MSVYRDDASGPVARQRDAETTWDASGDDALRRGAIAHAGAAIGARCGVALAPAAMIATLPVDLAAIVVRRVELCGCEDAGPRLPLGLALLPVGIVGLALIGFTIGTGAVWRCGTRELRRVREAGGDPATIAARLEAFPPSTILQALLARLERLRADLEIVCAGAWFHLAILAILLVLEGVAPARSTLIAAHLVPWLVFFPSQVAFVLVASRSVRANLVVPALALGLAGLCWGLGLGAVGVVVLVGAWFVQLAVINRAARQAAAGRRVES
jgi:hypothetical protein